MTNQANTTAGKQENEEKKLSTGDIVLQAALTILFLLATLYLIWAIYHAWPINKGDLETSVRLWPGCDAIMVSQEQNFLLLMLLGGATGAMLHIMVSYSAFVGNKDFVRSWIPWYILRPLIGALLALVFYLLLRGGLLTYSASADASIPNIDRIESKLDSISMLIPQKELDSPPIKNDSFNTATVATNTNNTYSTTESNKEPQDNKQQVPLPLNPFGLMAVACLAGLFSKQATQKLEEVFNNIFSYENKNKNKTGKDKEKEDQEKAAQEEQNQTTVDSDDINDAIPDADEGTEEDDNQPKG